jgi:hypothetical protein
LHGVLSAFSFGEKIVWAGLSDPSLCSVLLLVLLVISFPLVENRAQSDHRGLGE